ncbi:MULTISPECIES: hypothetical protein [unclassified Streptomyces]|uniref:hypothetical protein n=1 Tax=unclassified Streptomyces TaxID=2593676 RepID=UPI003FD46AE2
MARRPVAAVAAVLLFLEAIGIVLLNMVLGIAVDRQDMSLGGLDPDAMSVSTWVMGGLFGLYLASCALVLGRCALRDRAPGRLARILLITCAVVHGVLGALTVGLVGWAAFAFMMVVFGMVVLVLLAFPAGSSDAPDTPDTPAAPAAAAEA